MQMKKLLVITYSQSGQLDQIVSNILMTMEGKVEVYRHKIKPIPDFPFPWTDMSFWDAMPESVQCTPAQIEALDIDTSIDYDLIMIGYPIWFLSPPIPLTTFLKSDQAKKLLKGKPIVSVIGSRNMWINAQEDIKEMIEANKGRLVGNIALRDKNQNLISVVTIIYWMMQGKKDRYLGIFPKPGISDKDIKDSERFGQPMLQAIQNNDFSSLQNDLVSMDAVDIVPSIISLENKGKHIFRIWARFIKKKGGPGAKARQSRLKLFKWYLLFVIFIVSPIATLVFYLTYPLFMGRINRKLKYYRGLELKTKES